jgi:hypothetical protein
MGISFILLLIVGLAFGNYWKEKALLCIYFIVPYVALAMFGKIIFPRFVFFAAINLLPIVAFGLYFSINVFLRNLVKDKSSIAKKYSIIVLIIFCFLLSNAFICYQFIFNPISAQIASGDRGQYIENWPAGWGVSQSIAYFSSRAQNGKIYIGTEGTFGLMPESYEMYLVHNKNVTIKGIWPIENTMPKELVDSAVKVPTYVVFYQPCPTCSNTNEAPKSWQLMQVFQTSTLNTRLTIYQVIP